MFDTHCHLNSYLNSSTRFPNSLNSYLNVSTNVDDWSNTIKFSRKHANVLPAIGIHPWFVTESFVSDLVVLERLLHSNNIASIGEVGLDFNDSYKHTREGQIECFQQQLNLAESNQLPLSVHCVKAHNEMLLLLKSKHAFGVIHGLGTSIEIAKQYIDLGFKFGVNGVAVRENANRYHALIKYFGLEHIVLETDYPNIKLPGLVSSSLADINTIAECVANLLSIPIEDVIQQTDYNAQKIFQRN